MENTELLKRFVEYIDKIDRKGKKEELSDTEKKQAAYALNLCTVSVSQIIDYDDINILEQEYEAILNNINLENIPKDEALLNILKQLLDTITFFRIQEGDKKMIEKEYQHKMKNAIWSAVPNFGLIVAGGSPIDYSTMAISLASQVGIGYMNYRRNKAEYNLEKDKQMWQLQRSAIEQFNGLRRELFNTAWRLADAYNFSDEYRLTEKQIKQYNQILIDQDEIRKYERLESIKDNFEAYPPFWYFFGNSANFIANNKDLQLSESTRNTYRKKALEYFEKYEDANKYGLLREDQIAASCALEHIDILFAQENPDYAKVKELIAKAVKYSGNANDVLELCAINYLKINDQENAAKYLKILVNEDYNRVVNAQLLSGIYVHKQNREDYELLATRVDSKYLYPMPADGQDAKSVENEFVEQLKSVLKQKYKLTFEKYLLQKYSIEWNKITSIFNVAEVENDDFFMDTPKANARRMDVARQVFADENQSAPYIGRISHTNYELDMLNILNRLFDGLFKFELFNNPQIIKECVDEVQNKLVENKDKINSLQKTMTDGEFELSSYVSSQTITLKDIVGRALRTLANYECSLVDKANIEEITSMETSLRNFCIGQKIPEPEIMVNNNASTFENSFENSNEFFTSEIFGRRAILAKQNLEFLNDMSNFVKEKLNAVNLKDDTVSIYFRDDSEFTSFFFDSTYNNYPEIKSHAIAILKDNTKEKIHLIFTTNGVVRVQKNKVKNLTPYKEVQIKDNEIILYENFISEKFKYSTTAIDMLSLFDVIKEIGKKFIVNVEDKVEYFVEKPLTANILTEWFKKNKYSLEENVTRVIAVPSKEILGRLGYHLDAELEKDKNLLQFYYDNSTNDVLGMRIVRYENIDSNFQAKLLESNGIIKVSNK